MLQKISKQRFDALAGYIRRPEIVRAVQEFEWTATPGERVLGVLTWDRNEYDFAWSALAPDELKRYRWVGGRASFPSADAAHKACTEALGRLSKAPDEEFFQGDTVGKPVDFFTPVVRLEKLHPHFRVLAEQPRYAPARELISAMMRYHEDLDGNFVEQFQTSGFDARLWELYIYATATELNYARDSRFAVPDFCLTNPDGSFAIECATANPPDKGIHAIPQENAAFGEYVDNYIPIKLARALTAKLKKKYWEQPHLKGLPLVFAVQDFHSPGIMRAVTFAATEYVYGYRHSLVNGRQTMTPIKEHRYKSAVEPSGFFNFPEAENVSAVIVNAQGTLLKFNRMGYSAGFGDRSIHMTRIGIRRGERDPGDGGPKPFRQEVWADGYSETWLEGMTVLHNPHAKVPLDPMLLLGAAHEFIQGGKLMSMVPEFHPVYSQTYFHIATHDEASADRELAENAPTTP